VLPIMEAQQAELVSSDFQIDDGIVLESTPGHTPGHCSVAVSSNDQHGVITGDMIHHPVQIAENHFSSAFDVQKERAIETRRTFCEKYSDRDVRILGTHFAPPTAGHIVHTKGSWRLKV
jgi:glyoxylase-like metal-dependent hydrolase (beta-lactamase superfamily II)